MTVYSKVGEAVLGVLTSVLDEATTMAETRCRGIAERQLDRLHALDYSVGQAHLDLTEVQKSAYQAGFAAGRLLDEDDPECAKRAEKWMAGR